MRARLGVSAVLVCALVALGACSGSSKDLGQESGFGGGKGGTIGGQSLGRAPNVRTELLTVDDLGAGWAIDNSSGDNSSHGLGGSQDSCGGLDRAEPRTGDKSEAEVAFAKGESQVVNEAIEAYPSPAAARAAFARTSALLDGCESGSDSGVQYSIGRLNVGASYGDQSAAWRISLSNDQGTSAQVDLVLVSKGAQLLVVGYADMAQVGTQDLDQVASIAVSKVNG